MHINHEIPKQILEQKLVAIAADIYFISKAIKITP